MKISVCYIAKNEAQDLPRSLQSVKAAADEIIFVDTGSTDDTIKIAHDFGAKIFRFKWCNDFSAARNYAIEQATGDWIIFPDADEYFRYPEKVRPCVETISQTDADAAMVLRINVTAPNEQTEHSRDYSMRTFRRSPKLRYQSPIHEMLTRADGNLKLFYADENLSMYHTGYAGARLVQKVRRNMDILQETIDKNGEMPWHYLYLPSHYYALGEYEKALAAAKKAIASPVKSYGSSSDCYHIALESLRRLNGSLTEMLALADAAISEYPDLPEYYAERGMILCGMGEYDAAYRSFGRSIEIFEQKKGPSYEYSYIYTIVDKIYCRMAELENFVGDYEKALSNIKKALSANPNNDKAQKLCKHLTLL